VAGEAAPGYEPVLCRPELPPRPPPGGGRRAASGASGLARRGNRRLHRRPEATGPADRPAGPRRGRVRAGHAAGGTGLGSIPGQGPANGQTPLGPRGHPSGGRPSVPARAIAAPFGIVERSTESFEHDGRESMRAETLPASPGADVPQGPPPAPRLWLPVTLLSLFWVLFFLVDRVDKLYFVGFLYALISSGL